MGNLEILHHNQQLSYEALKDLYRLREVNKYFFDSYCEKAVKMLEHLTSNMPKELKK